VSLIDRKPGAGEDQNRDGDPNRDITAVHDLSPLAAQAAAPGCAPARSRAILPAPLLLDKSLDADIHNLVGIERSHQRAAHNGSVARIEGLPISSTGRGSIPIVCYLPAVLHARILWHVVINGS